jgi:predicted PurR-regulated permease PerM
MSEPDPVKNLDLIQRNVIELALRMGVLFILLFWCFQLIKPFVLIIAWGMIVAIALFPVFHTLMKALGGRQKLAATALTLLLVAILIVPSVLLTESLIEGAQALSDAGDAGQLVVPAPAENVKEWPLIGEQAYELWQQAARDLPRVIEEFTPQIKELGSWALSVAAGTGLGILQFVISFVIAGIMLTAAESSKITAQALAVRLAGKQGEGFADLSVNTIRNVALGIVGVSIIQTALLSLGFLAIGLPAAGLIALVVLVLCIIQIGPALVAIPAIIYVFATADTMPATIFAVWTFVMMIIDSILKPMVFGRGSSVPTLVIFLGAIGGMLAYGIIGLFVGAVVLALGYKIYESWLAEASSDAEDTSAELANTTE